MALPTVAPQSSSSPKIRSTFQSILDTLNDLDIDEGALASITDDIEDLQGLVEDHETRIAVLEAA